METNLRRSSRLWNHRAPFLAAGGYRTWVQVVVQMEVEAKNLVDMMHLRLAETIRCAQRSQFIDRAYHW